MMTDAKRSPARSQPSTTGLRVNRCPARQQKATTASAAFLRLPGRSCPRRRDAQFDATVAWRDIKWLRGF
jgi:hypothetical protein